MIEPACVTMHPIPGVEIVHFFDARDRITSRGDVVTAIMGGELHRVVLPLPRHQRILAATRLSRRALRLDKCNVVPTGDRSALMIAHQGVVYRYGLASRRLEPTYRLRQCRNMMHQSVLAHGEASLYFGEYGANPGRDPVDVVASHDAGRTWEVAYRFAAGRIRHVHGVYRDPYTGRLWVPTGDFSGECWMVVADPEFRDVQEIGNGDQRFRAVAVLFREDRVVWLMDSQLETSHAVSWDRATGEITIGRAFPGPVWYVKELTDGVTLAATTYERGEGVHTDSAHLYASRDLATWTEIMKIRHDGLPLGLFKFGVIGFADGAQASDDFAVFFEALKGVDGRAFRARLRTGALPQG